ncbi:MAG TPA: M28 family metallopeptidase [Thermoanaerobaculia bacterium]|nr:M28 family metallopeptidase [Thermoanaerobaculia bacterium]
MNPSSSIIFSGLIMLAPFVQAGQAEPGVPEVAQGRSASSVPMFRPEAIGAHIRFLADDSLEGRSTGSRGFAIAARYVASQLAAAGCQAGGDTGTFFQTVKLRRVELVPSGSSVTLTTAQGVVDLLPGRDYVMSGDPVREKSFVRAPVVYVGYGIVAPELEHDDYDLIDVKGRIVVFLSGAPERFPADQRAFHGSARTKELTAVARGAVGTLSFRSPVDESRISWEGVQRQYGAATMRWLDSSGRPSDVSPELQGSAVLSRRGAEKLFPAAPRTVDQMILEATGGIGRGFAVPVEASITKVSSHSSVQSSNVIGVIPGADPALRHETVLFSGHLDHLEPSAGGGDSVYNGAYDNASGVAVMLEIARKFGAASLRPARSIAFVALTGEEKGLLGSDYLARTVPKPLGRIVANVNMDTLLMLYPIVEVVAHGAEHSTLGPVAERAARRVGLTVVPDPSPEEVRFVRSDQYSFVKQGIPAISIKAGTRSGDPGLDGRVLNRAWQRTVYHTVDDDLSQTFDLASGVRYAQLGFLIGEEVASRREPPKWNAGDFFGERFGRRTRPGR